MRFSELIEADNRKRNKLIFFRQTIDSIREKIQGKTLVVFDTETTGFSAKLPWVQVTEIAAVAFDADTGEQLATYHKKINLRPETKDEIRVQKRNMTDTDRGSIEGPKGLNIPDLFRMSRYGDDDAPRVNMSDAYQGFSDFINQYNRPILIAQNAAFDMGHMFGPMKKLGITRPSYQEVLDTVTLGRVWIYPLLKAAEELDILNSKAMLEPLEVERNGRKSVSVTLDRLGKAFGVTAKHWHSGISDVYQTYGVFKSMIDFMQAAKDAGLDNTDTFNKMHQKMSNQAFHYGKQPAFGATVDSETKRGIAARGKPRT